jgi:MoaA/NifB/PqqE/SkfB family radical SAM enzyme
MKHFNDNYDTRSTTFLGGEPFLHPDILLILRDARALGMSVAICTNGFKISRKLENCPGLIDDLRVSIDGLGKAHDLIRRRTGSFDACVETLRTAKTLKIPTSVTHTLTATNADDLPGLTHFLAGLGVSYLKLHRLRNIGFASTDPSLEPTSDQLNMIAQLVPGLRRTAGVDLIVDGDLLGDTFEMSADQQLRTVPTVLDHVELNPDGNIYLSCKAVGDAEKAAFHYDRDTDTVSYRPTATDELTLTTPQVVYYQIGAAASS